MVSLNKVPSAVPNSKTLTFDPLKKGFNFFEIFSECTLGHFYEFGGGDPVGTKDKQQNI